MRRDAYQGCCFFSIAAKRINMWCVLFATTPHLWLAGLTSASACQPRDSIIWFRYLLALFQIFYSTHTHSIQYILPIIWHYTCRQLFTLALHARQLTSLERPNKIFLPFVGKTSTIKALSSIHIRKLIRSARAACSSTYGTGCGTINSLSKSTAGKSGNNDFPLEINNSIFNHYHYHHHHHDRNCRSRVFSMHIKLTE